MPLTPKGSKIMASMKSEYGPEKGEKVFYASRNKGTIKGVEKKKRDMAKKYPGGVSYSGHHAHEDHELPSNRVLRHSKRGVHHDYY